MKRKRQNTMSKSDPIPGNMTIEETSASWNTHSAADYPLLSLLIPSTF
jgi:hypothetical protein